MRANHPAFFMLFAMFVAGCATTDDLNRLRGEFNYQIQAEREKIVSIERQYAPLKEELQSLHEKTAKTNADFSPIRSAQAELRAEMTEIKGRIQQLRGQIDGLKEEIRKESSSLAAKTTRAQETDKFIREKIDALAFKINFIENYLGIEKKEEHPNSGAVVDKPSQSAQPAGKTGAGEAVKTDKASLYAAAFALFKEGKYEKAREAFGSFLKQYPNSEFSDNVQFWIGECYYFEKKYEKAIVEYDKVVKNFPGGNKTSYALLKQGLSFLKLGDRDSARLLLQQVTKDFPNTSQARMARAKLLEIK